MAALLLQVYLQNLGIWKSGVVWWRPFRWEDSNMTSKAPVRVIKASSAAASPITGIADGELARQRADIEKILQDLQLVNNRLHEARGLPIPVPGAASQFQSIAAKDSGSQFVSSLRAMADSERRAAETKLTHMQQLLDKVCEYDRLILNKTAPPEVSASGAPFRRKSLGADLHSLPSHLRIVDRLVDLYNQSKRVTVIRTNGTVFEEASKPSAEPETSQADRTLIESLKTSLGRTTIKLDEAEKKRTTAEAEQVKSQLVINALKKEVEELQGKLAGRAGDQQLLAEQAAVWEAEKQKYEQQLTDMKQQLHDSNQENAHLQRRFEEEASALQSVLRTLLSKVSSIRTPQRGNQEYTHLVSPFILQSVIDADPVCCSLTSFAMRSLCWIIPFSSTLLD